jgi:hypothetical protein
MNQYYLNACYIEVRDSSDCHCTCNHRNFPFLLIKLLQFGIFAIDPLNNVVTYGSECALLGKVSC